ncbi:MAG: DNA alkylation repair protein [Actinomycetota bacterium]|nr:DNA alkylation repair protein [Actinomycetota bacterium]MDQ2957351.1 DNA alkylation repair protein [Actinomycetota bacterium]
MTEPAADRELIEQIRHALAEAADPERAPTMQAYMKSTMPYLGVAVPTVRSITRRLERGRPPADEAQLLATVTESWRTAEFREHRYAATELLNTATARRLSGAAGLPLLEELIRQGAWWDHVDELSHRVGELLAAYPDELSPVIRQWAVSEDRWLRRSAVICQLGRKGHTDTELLSYAIDANLGDRDFFLRKAIGWALREYARTDPGWVVEFVRDRGDRLSPLSVREATKHL